MCTGTGANFGSATAEQMEFGVITHAAPPAPAPITQYLTERVGASSDGPLHFLLLNYLPDKSGSGCRLHAAGRVAL